MLEIAGSPCMKVMHAQTSAAGYTAKFKILRPIVRNHYACCVISHVFTEAWGTEAPFLDLRLSISNGFVSSKIYDKRDDFDFDIVNFPFLDGDVPRSTS